MKFLVSLGKWALFAAIVSVVTVLVSFVTIQTYVNKLLEQFALGERVQVQFSDFLSELGGSLNILDPKRPYPQSEGTGLAGKDEAEQGGGPLPHSESSTGPEREEDDGHSVSDGAIPVLGHINSQDVLVTQEQFQEVKDRLSEADKMELFTLVFSRLPAEELQNLSTYMEDGITAAEFEQIDNMLRTYLDPAEYERVLDILEQY